MSRRSSSVVDSALYRDGCRVGEALSLGEIFRRLRDEPGTSAWIGLYRPEEPELLALAAEFGLHELAVEDAIHAHQRPKLERYGDTLFVVLRVGRYLDATEEIELSELHVFVGQGFIITVRHGEVPDLRAVRSRMETTPELLRLGPEAVLYAILDEVVDGYAPVVDGLQNDIDEIESQVFGGDPLVPKRIYKLSREVVDFQRATRPMAEMLAQLTAGFEEQDTPAELRERLRDVRDHVVRIIDRVDAIRQALQDILNVNATLVAQEQNAEMKALTEAGYRQNEQVKRISAWAAILFAPTLVGTVYGMNFDHIPELHWAWGYPFSLLLMGTVSATLYTVFKRRGWL